MNPISSNHPSLVNASTQNQETTAPRKETIAEQKLAEVTPFSTVSQQARELESMQQELRSLPDVDLERVNQIRAELQQGTFSVDLDELAGAIFSTHHSE
ncbi:flagellar biosynthesis anti-sigma factor FlgM [Vibrio mexicanus]|uniref:flagellar biosynthesis anti-sigma factor FlgM n=1 Tax=Vibrio mexicanus TaxID=1004326 RepID=UPI00069A7610|nr:flagellar biosynthesis anti-sigma factor FlgM [Vibrio mexicanus]